MEALTLLNALRSIEVDAAVMNFNFEQSSPFDTSTLADFTWYFQFEGYEANENPFTADAKVIFTTAEEGPCTHSCYDWF